MSSSERAVYCLIVHVEKTIKGQKLNCYLSELSNVVAGSVKLLGSRFCTAGELLNHLVYCLLVSAYLSCRGQLGDNITAVGMCVF